MKHKKAQSISINTIVVAAIALVVLILIVLIFTQNIGNFRRSADSCLSVGGSCYDRERVEDGELCSGNYEKVTNNPCFDSQGNQDPNLVCCLRV